MTTETLIETTVETVTEVADETESLKNELARTRELVAKLRKFEKENKQAVEVALADAKKHQEQYNASQQELNSIRDSVRARSLTDGVTKALTEAGAISVPTVSKLLDQSKIEFDGLDLKMESVQAQIEALKQSDPVLFGVKDGGDQKPAFDVKRVAETDPVGGYEKEIRAAKTQKDILAVMKKYGKIQ